MDAHENGTPLEERQNMATYLDFLKTLVEQFSIEWEQGKRVAIGEFSIDPEVVWTEFSNMNGSINTRRSSLDEIVYFFAKENEGQPEPFIGLTIFFDDGNVMRFEEIYYYNDKEEEWKSYGYWCHLNPNQTRKLVTSLQGAVGALDVKNCRDLNDFYSRYKSGYLQYRHMKYVSLVLFGDNAETESENGLIITLIRGDKE